MNCVHVHVTSDMPWHPCDSPRGDQEASMRASLESEPRPRGRTVDATTTREQNRSLVQTQCISAATDTGSFTPVLEECTVRLSAAKAKKRKGAVSVEEPSKHWRIGLDTANQTLERTTQRAVRDFLHTTGGRRLKPHHCQLKCPRLNCEMCMDTVFGKIKSLQGNSCAQAHCAPFHWCLVDPIESKGDAPLTLDSLFQKVGTPKALIPDNTTELTQGAFRKKSLKAQCPILLMEAHTPNRNCAEDVIGELKRAFGRQMAKTETPEVLWDLCLVHCTLTQSHKALKTRDLDGEVPEMVLTGDTTDISHICEFGWCQWVWFMSPPREGSMETKRLGRHCGPSFDVGEALCAWCLMDEARLVSGTSVFPLTQAEIDSEAIKVKKQVHTDVDEELELFKSDVTRL